MTERALRIIKSGDLEKIKALRDTNATYSLFFGFEYTFKPNRAIVEPKRIFPCRFKENCNRKSTCKFYHSNGDRYLPVTICFSYRHEEYVEVMFPLAEPVFGKHVIEIKMFLPFTETLYKITQQHQAILREEARAKGLWKTAFCVRKNPHDAKSCTFRHPEDDQADATAYPTADVEVEMS